MLREYRQMEVIPVVLVEKPGILIQLACDITQKTSLNKLEAPESTVKFLIEANHTSLFEHISTTWIIRGVSRSFLAQITRHRMASYTAASQHYQEYSGYPNVVGPEMYDSTSKAFFNSIDAFYTELIDRGVKPEEARQVLPNAKAVTILWTINCRSLFNFLNLRLCERNTAEMLHFANLVRDKCFDWWPEAFKHIGPDCLMLGKCRQGKMMAEKCKKNGSPWIRLT